MIKLTTFGSDPEIFLSRDGKPISAVGLVPGTKRDPFIISDKGEAIQLDNVAVELNTAPCKTPEEFISSLEVCYGWLHSHLAMIDPLIQLHFAASERFPDSELNTVEARMFGCEPDFNAWDDGRVNSSPCASDKNLRSAGGHVHLGLETDCDEEDVNRLVRLLDKHVGTYALDICGDRVRQELYGKAGAYREKSYGLEYRTPSVSWIKTHETIKGVFDRILLAIEDYNNNLDAEESVKNYINGSIEYAS